MSEELARVGLVTGALAAALAIAWWARVRAARRGAPIDVGGLVTGPGVVIFTRDDCRSCTETLVRLGKLGLPVRRVRAEQEPDELERRGVTGVPITVFVGGAGRPCGQFAGLPRMGPLRRAARRAAEIPGSSRREP